MSPLFVGSGSTGSEGRSDRFGLPTAASDPGTAEAGDLYFNTTDNQAKVYNGTAWVQLAGSSAAPDGSVSNPAVSAAQLLADYPNTPSGLYYLQTTGGSTQVYCEMERQGGGWVLALQHQCVNDQGIDESLLTGAVSGTPNSGSSDFNGAGTLTGTQLWNEFVGSGQTGMIYAREIQTSGGTYDETQQYVSASGGNLFNYQNFSDLFNPVPANGSYQTGVRVIYRNGTRQSIGKQQTVWSSPSLVTINNGQVDQELYYCNGQDGGDQNWSFGLMQGGTPYPRTANAANGGGRNSITRWAQMGFRSAGVAVPSDPFGDNSGIAYFPLTNTNTATYNGKSVGNTQWNGTAGGNGTFTADGYTQSDSGANAFVIPAPNSQSIGEWFTGTQDWALSMSFKLVANPATATNRGLMHMSAGNDYDRPAIWVAGPNRGTPNVVEYFSSSNGTSWDLARGDTASTGRGSTTISNGTWYHVVFTYSSSAGFRGYVNGNLDYTDTNTGTHYSTGDYAINVGNWFQNGNGYGFHGSIKNLRFFRKNLSASDASTLYTLDI